MFLLILYHFCHFAKIKKSHLMTTYLNQYYHELALTFNPSKHTIFSPKWIIKFGSIALIGDLGMMNWTKGTNCHYKVLACFLVFCCCLVNNLKLIQCPPSISIDRNCISIIIIIDGQHYVVWLIMVLVHSKGHVNWLWKIEHFMGLTTWKLRRLYLDFM